MEAFMEHRLQVSLGSNYSTVDELAPTQDKIAWAVLAIRKNANSERGLREIQKFLDKITESTKEEYEYRAAAAYMAARIEHWHLRVPNIESVEDRYYGITRLFPDSFYSQLAVLKLAAMHLARQSAVVEAWEWIDRYELKLATEPLEDSIRAVLHLLLADAILEVNGDETRALYHLERRYNIGTANRSVMKQLLTRLIRLNARLGNHHAATAWLKEYESNFAFDITIPQLRQTIHGMNDGK
jgi:hypothetical protein